MTRTIHILLLTLLLSACGHEGIPSADRTASFGPGAASAHWTVINYWAVWCAPCREEIPELNTLAERHADVLRVFGVNYDGASGPKLDAAIHELGIKFPVLEKDPQPALGIARPQVLPVTLIIRPNGSLHQLLLGPQTADGLWRVISNAIQQGAEQT